MQHYLLSSFLIVARNLVRVVVVGGGYSGVEIATSIANYLGKGRAAITLVDRNDIILPSSPQSTRNSALK